MLLSVSYRWLWVPHRGIQRPHLTPNFSFVGDFGHTNLQNQVCFSLLIAYLSNGQSDFVGIRQQIQTFYKF